MSILTPAVRRSIERLSPNQSLALMAVPVALIEPLKFVAVAVAGEERWITGAAMVIADYPSSLFVVETIQYRQTKAADASSVHKALGNSLDDTKQSNSAAQIVLLV